MLLLPNTNDLFSDAFDTCLQCQTNYILKDFAIDIFYKPHASIIQVTAYLLPGSAIICTNVLCNLLQQAVEAWFHNVLRFFAT